MNTRRNAALCLTAAALLLPSCITLIAHSETAAAAAATEFAQTAFIKRDYAAAHGLLSKLAQEKVSLDQTTDVIPKMHPKGYPSELTATDFEPFPGQRAMTIYVNGSGDGEELHYRLVMDGDATLGYRVQGFFRDFEVHKSSGKQPLHR